MFDQGRFDQFLARAQTMLDKHHADSPTAKPVLSTMVGGKNIRVVITTWGQRSVFCFVDRATGDVLKADGWARPAKHARSNINADDFGMSGVTAYGGVYLR